MILRGDLDVCQPGEELFQLSLGTVLLFTAAWRASCVNCSMLLVRNPNKARIVVF